MASLGDEARDRNLLFEAALEFGPNWRRPVGELAAERLPHLDPDKMRKLSEEVSAARAAIEAWIANRCLDVGLDWSPSDHEDSKQYICAIYPWMTLPNVTRAVSQGMYYVWHG